MHLKSRPVREPQRWILRADDAAVGAPWKRLRGSSSYPFGVRRMEGNARVGNALWGERPLPSRCPDPPASSGRPNGPLHPLLFQARRKMPPPPDARRVPAAPAPARARANHPTDRDPTRPNHDETACRDGHVDEFCASSAPACSCRASVPCSTSTVAVDVHGASSKTSRSAGGRRDRGREGRPRPAARPRNRRDRRSARPGADDGRGGGQVRRRRRFRNSCNRSRRD